MEPSLKAELGISVFFKNFSIIKNEWIIKWMNEWMNNKMKIINEFVSFFIKLITYYCTSPI